MWLGLAWLATFPVMLVLIGLAWLRAWREEREIARIERRNEARAAALVLGGRWRAADGSWEDAS